MNREEIMTILPHREPMLLLDDVENREGTAIGHYTVRGDEFFLKGHFPDFPIVPGVILCEILAQTACVLMKDAMKEGELPVYTGLNNVRFRSPVKPGDTVETRCSLFCRRHCHGRRTKVCNRRIFLCNYRSRNNRNCRYRICSYGGCNYRNCTYRNCSYRICSYRGCNYRNCTYRGCSFRGINYRGCSYRRHQLQGLQLQERKPCFQKY